MLLLLWMMTLAFLLLPRLLQFSVVVPRSSSEDDDMPLAFVYFCCWLRFRKPKIERRAHTHAGVNLFLVAEAKRKILRTYVVRKYLLLSTLLWGALLRTVYVHSYSPVDLCGEWIFVGSNSLLWYRDYVRTTILMYVQSSVSFSWSHHTPRLRLTFRNCCWCN